jgi:glycosyltransferase involved in cell wall biosynthesis
MANRPISPAWQFGKQMIMNSIGILWAQYGPYHLARVAALKKLAGLVKVHALELASQTSHYEWKRGTTLDLITLCPSAVAEQLSFWRVFRRARRVFAELKIEVCLLPSYAPRQPLAALLAAKSLGIRTVMMNESHAGTARARGISAWVKRRLVSLFDSALVGGTPQKRYFESLGLARESIFTGYDAVDNDYFARRAKEIRIRESEVRGQYDLPEHYFLSLSRFVAKKNLPTLIHAYRKFLDANPTARIHLVMVGSGEEGPGLLALCKELNLPIRDKTKLAFGNRPLATTPPGSGTPNDSPGVHFYGFRQIEENPVFFALADAFIMPSLYEEWGLVVNEAMACGLPVIVSETAGCAEDLLEPTTTGEENYSSLVASAGWTALQSKVRRNGFVFDPKSIAELSGALSLLNTQPELRAGMGEASQRIVESFSCENFAENALAAVQASFGSPVVPR